MNPARRANFVGYLVAVLLAPALIHLLNSIYRTEDWRSGAGLVVSIVLYGSAVFAIPAIMAAAIGDYLGLSRAATAFATVTIFFAVGQTIGPAGAGLIARMHGSFTTAYRLASLLTALAAVFAAFLPHPSRAEAE